MDCLDAPRRRRFKCGLESADFAEAQVQPPLNVVVKVRSSTRYLQMAEGPGIRGLRRGSGDPIDPIAHPYDGLGDPVRMEITLAVVPR